MSTIKLGVTLAGPTSLRNAASLIEDWAEAQGEDTALVAVLDGTVDEAGEFPPGVRAAAGFALKYGLDIELVVPQDQKVPADNEQYAAVLEAAATVVKSANPAAGVIRRSDVVFLAWEVESTDEDDQPTEASIKALEAAERLQKPAFDLTDGLLPLAFDSGAEEEPEPAQEPKDQAPDQPDGQPTSADHPNPAPDADSDQLLTLGHDIVEHLATAVAAAVLAEVLPLIEQIKAQTAPRPRGRPRKVTEEE